MTKFRGGPAQAAKVFAGSGSARAMGWPGAVLRSGSRWFEGLQPAQDANQRRATKPGRPRDTETRFHSMITSLHSQISREKAGQRNVVEEHLVGELHIRAAEDTVSLPLHHYQNLDSNPNTSSTRRFSAESL